MSKFKLHKRKNTPPDDSTSYTSNRPSDYEPGVVIERSSRNIPSIISTILVIMIAPVIALVLTFFVFQQYQVDGPSMQNTLQTGNRLIVLKLPRTWARLTGHPYIPQRGNIVVFVEPGIESLTSTGSDQLIKRVIGLPGDHIVVSNGKVMIYNKAHPKGFDPDYTMSYFKGRKVPYTSGTTNLVVPPNHVFVMGDNRPDSLDSRVFGTVPVNEIIGKLALRITPISEYRVF